MIRHRIVNADKSSEDGGEMVNGGLQEIKQDDAEDDINNDSGHFNKQSIIKNRSNYQKDILKLSIQGPINLTDQKNCVNQAPESPKNYSNIIRKKQSSSLTSEVFHQVDESLHT
jgi:ribosome-binding protein aMBF1 (putative translation factor)